MVVKKSVIIIFKNKFPSMKSSFSYFLPILLVISFFTVGNTLTFGQIKKISVNFEVQASNKEFKSVSSQIAICYYKNYSLIEIPIFSMTKEFHAKNDSSSFKEISSKENTGFRYYMYENNSDHGLYYDSLMQEQGVKFCVDTLLKEKAFAGASFQNSDTDSLIKSIKITGQYTSAIEVFSRTSNLAKISKDTLVFHYTNHLQGIPYSFSQILDRQQKGKVYKIEYMYLAGETNSGNTNLFHKMRAIFEIGKIENGDRKLSKYFDKFINELK